MPGYTGIWCTVEGCVMCLEISGLLRSEISRVRAYKSASPKGVGKRDAQMKKNVSNEDAQMMQNEGKRNAARPQTGA